MKKVKVILDGVAFVVRITDIETPEVKAYATAVYGERPTAKNTTGTRSAAQHLFVASLAKTILVQVVNL